MPLYIFLIIMLVAFDQIIKYSVVHSLPLDHYHVVFAHILSITHVENSGAAWSILTGQTWFFALITIVALGFFGYYWYHLMKRWPYALSLSFLIGGTIGNFIDRIRHSYVVDMFSLDFINFPIFNFADATLTLGVIGIILAMVADEWSSRKQLRAPHSKEE